MVAGLRANGVEVTEHEDGMTVHGRGADGVPGGGTVATHLDHRIAMAFLCLGLAARNPVRIDDAGPIATSFPSFTRLMSDLGASFTRDNP
jgi:3-phosphoshikimate 1-carboxyvinyltransferase